MYFREFLINTKIGIEFYLLFLKKFLQDRNLCKQSWPIVWEENLEVPDNLLQILLYLCHGHLDQVCRVEHQHLGNCQLSNPKAVPQIVYNGVEDLNPDDNLEVFSRLSRNIGTEGLPSTSPGWNNIGFDNFPTLQHLRPDHVVPLIVDVINGALQSLNKQK